MPSAAALRDGRDTPARPKPSPAPLTRPSFSPMRVGVTELIKSIVLGIVEGVTEFLPVSSTGHMRICEAWMGDSTDDAQWKLFTVFIQIGAILAVVVYFRERILELLRG